MTDIDILRHEKLCLLVYANGFKMITACHLRPRGASGHGRPEVEFSSGLDATTTKVLFDVHKSSFVAAAMIEVHVLPWRVVEGIDPKIGGVYANNLEDTERILVCNAVKIRRARKLMKRMAAQTLLKAGTANEAYGLPRLGRDAIQHIVSFI
jgi:hypothetical protein